MTTATKILSPTMTAALAYLATVPAGQVGYVKTTTAKALRRRGLIAAAPGRSDFPGTMRCVLV